MLSRLQRTMVAAQVAEAVARISVCPTCSAQLACKGHHHLVFRSAFGRLSIDSPRMDNCSLSSKRAACAAAVTTKANSPPCEREDREIDALFARQVDLAGQEHQG